MTDHLYHTAPNNQDDPKSTRQPKPDTIRWRFLAMQLTALLMVTFFFALFDLDRKIAAQLFNAKEGFHLRHYPLWVWLYHYGTLPGAVLTLMALVGWGISFWNNRLYAWRRPLLLVVLTAVIGSGLLVNGILKQYWGRPRPNQTVEFGGYWQYRGIFPPGLPGKGSSFPCGHCAMGFVFIALWGCRRLNKPIAVGGVVTGIALGGLLSAARVIQGAHFVSDTLWSLGLMTLTATVFDDLLIRRPERKRDPGIRIQKSWVLVITAAAVVLLLMGYMTRRPYYESDRYPLALDGNLTQIDIRFNEDPVRLNILYGNQDQGWLQVDTRGLGWINADTRLEMASLRNTQTLQFNLHMTVRSYFDELDHTLTLTLPRAFKNQIEVRLNGTHRLAR